ncbi:MAG: T9SS type A sorting domain-containing protein [Ignavibacteriaceae bacterium]|nr:T9SS type A sorting domain-containing protein [Ignavibacteriaceae bacterium]
MKMKTSNYTEVKLTRKKLTIMLFISFILNLSFLPAQDGVLDGTFNSTGKVTTSFGSGYDGGKSVAIQADGKIVVVGVYPHGTDDDFAVVRYLSDGTLDATFGTGGKVTTSIGSNRDAAYSIAIQSDGKIAVVGATSNGTNNDLGMVRYNDDGTLDNGFGTNGIVTTVVGTSDNPAYGVAIQSNGNIVVVGYAHIGLTDDFMVVRYNSNGTLDTGFDTDGIVTTAIGAAGDVANSVTIQSDGKIVVAGYVGGGGFINDFAVARYNSDGSLDNTFDTDGIVTTAIGSASDVGYSVAIQSDGKIVVAGYAHMTTDDFAVVRYTSTGALDNTFSTDGKVTTDFSSGNDWGYSVALQLDGKIVVAGYASSSGSKIAVVRYNDDGSLDTGFGTSGKVTTAIGANGDYGNSVALQSGGKIVVAGNSYVNGSDADFAVVRYSGSSGPLPVELVSFTASIITRSIELEWATATEVNNYGFEIERASTSLGITDKRWEKIGFVQGNGNSNSTKEYNFTDNTATSGLYAYRLKQLDNDGKYEYSKEVEADLGMPNEFSLKQNFPNPFNPETAISYQMPVSGKASLKVFDMLGREVVTLVDEVKEAGTYNVSFNGKAFTSGAYFYRFQSGNYLKINKMILMK